MATPLLPAVVVVGGAGCLGRTLVRRWCARLQSSEDCTSVGPASKPRVVSLDRRLNPNAEANVLVDLSDTDAVERLLFGRFVVQAMVVAVKPPLVGPSYQSFIELNVAAICELARLAEHYKVGQFVYASSIACSNHWAPHENTSETDPSSNPHLTTLHSPYDLSKAVAERFILKQHSPSGMHTVSIRMGGLYGADDDPYWHRRLPFGLSFDLAIDPSYPKVDTNYVENVAEAMLRVVDHLAKDASVGGKFYFYTHGDRRASQQEISLMLAQRSGRIHMGIPIGMLRGVMNTLHLLTALPLMLPASPLKQTAGRSVNPKSYFSLGSFSRMGFIHQSFDNSLFRTTFNFSHVSTVEQAVEEIHKHDLQHKAESGGSWFSSGPAGSAMLSAAVGPISLCLWAAFVVCGCSGVSQSVQCNASIGAISSEIAQACIVVSSPVTHILAFTTQPTYKLWQPFRGGALHVTLQGIGWTMFSIMCAQWLLTLLQSRAQLMLGDSQDYDHVALLTDSRSKAASGLMSQFLLGLSLLVFKGHGVDVKKLE